MLNDALRECPFCGGEAKVAYRALAYEVGCLNKTCPGYIHADYDTHAAAVAAWNRRAALDRAQGQVWEPVEDGELVPTVTDGTLRVYERNGTLGKAMVLQRGSFHGDIILEDGYALCRLTPAAEPVAQDERPRGDAGEA